jgi:large subunit ribosomal protein L6
MAVTGVAEERVEIPEGVDIEISGDEVVVRKGDTVLSKRLSHPRVEIRLEDGTVRVTSHLPKKKEMALVGTYAAHIRNMIKGVTEGFTYTMRVVYAHFPMKVSVREGRVIIENFMGERHPRTAKIRGDTKVEVKGDTLHISGPNLEDVGQTAANIEQATRIKKKDPRVFQDGIYLVSKGEA